MVVAKFGGSSLADANQIRKVFKIVSGDPNKKCVVVSAPGRRSASDPKVTDMLINCAKARLDALKTPSGDLAGGGSNTAIDASGPADATGEANADSVARAVGATGATDSAAKTCALGAAVGAGQGDYGLGAIVERFSSISNELGLRDEFISDIKNDLEDRLSRCGMIADYEFLDLMKAAGEDNCAKLIAAYFNQCGLESVYVNPKDVGFFLNDDFGNAQVLQETYKNLECLKQAPETLIFPGFFGYTKQGKVITFSRGGSDITGSILAAALDADLYENFTDVSNVFSVDPSIVQNPTPISELTYREMRELSYAGFNVYHEDALIPVFEKGIPVHIKNTNDPEAEGTSILPHRARSKYPVVGISAAKGFVSINISKLLMNSEVGFGRRVMQIIEEEGIPFEHIPSGIDNMSVIINAKFITTKNEENIVRRIADELEVDEVGVRHNLAIVMLVGEGMLNTVGTTAKASAALAKANINLEIINQGASEVSLMFGLDEKVAEKAVIALYREFFP